MMTFGQPGRDQSRLPANERQTVREQRGSGTGQAGARFARDRGRQSRRQDCAGEEPNEALARRVPDSISFSR